jgi:hypothetical protein
MAIKTVLCVFTALLVSKTIWQAPDKTDAFFGFLLLFIAATELACCVLKD